MREYTILTINPGSTGTKTGVVRGGRVLLDQNVDNLPGEFDGCATYADQAPLREAKIFAYLENAGIDLKSIDAVSGRGVGVRSCVGGTYLIDELAYSHALNDVEGIHHPATLGIVMARHIGLKLGKPAYFVNPMNTDELSDLARMTGIPGLYRPAHSHPLNQKQVGIHHSKLQDKRYEECNYIIAHMGGGISITAHQQGKMVDSTRIGDGQGPISPNRAGDICVDDVVTLVNRGMTLQEAEHQCSGGGGLKALTGSDDLRYIRRELIAAGDRKAALAVDAMEYTIVKWIAMMAGALRGKADAILLTGGLAYDEALVNQLKTDCDWIAPVYVYPGSFETEALAAGAERVLTGEEPVRTYTGRPAWSGFDLGESW